MFKPTRIFGKVGTWPRSILEYRGDKPPEEWEVGDKVEIRDKSDYRINEWTTCRVWMIDRWCGEAIYFFEL